MARKSRARAALCVGPWARGIATADSDIDLLLLTANGEDRPPHETVLADLDVGVEYRSADEFDQWPEMPLLDFPSLRMAGRLALSVPVAPDLDLTPSLRARAIRSTLEPACAWPLFNLADEATSLVDEESYERLYSIMGALTALAMLALNLHPAKYQKPKWVIPDLRHYEEADLVQLLGAAYNVRQAATVIADLKEQLGRGADLIGKLPTKEKEGDPGLALRIASDNFKGAAGLLNSGDELAAVFTAFAACRVLVDPLIDAPNEPLRQQGSDWRDQCIKIAGAPDQLAEPGELTKQIRECGSDLLARYKVAVRRAAITGQHERVSVEA